MKDERPTHLDLFSGIGGFALAARWAGFRTIGFCEIDKYCQKVLAKNFMADTESNRDREQSETYCGENNTGEVRSIRTNQLCSIPRIFSNIFDLDGKQFSGVDLITGGFPCQPFSVAGKRRGAADDRAIWPEMFRVIKEARPAWVLGENVPGIIPMELDNVLSDLEGIGYATRSFVIPACAVDARHRRDRVWIIGRLVGKSCGNGLSENETVDINSAHSEQSPQYDAYGFGSRNAYTDSKGLERQRQITCGTGTQLNNTGDHCRWLPEPNVGRVAHGIPSWVDRLKGLGNAIVPQVAYQILKEIRELIYEKPHKPPTPDSR